MKDHWHFVVWPREDGELADFFRWMTLTHVMRWRVAHRKVGYGPLYQGRFKGFVVKKGESLLSVCRVVERNALSAGVVARAEDWRWSSLGQGEGVWGGKRRASEDAGPTLGGWSTRFGAKAGRGAGK